MASLETTSACDRFSFTRIARAPRYQPLQEPLGVHVLGLDPGPGHLGGNVLGQESALGQAVVDRRVPSDENVGPGVCRLRLAPGRDGPRLLDLQGNLRREPRGLL